MKPNIEIKILADFKDRDGAPLLDSEGASVSYKRSVVRTKDEIKMLIGDANARVSVSLSETVPGPYGYSNLKVSVTVTLNCDQNQKTIEQAENAALQECIAFLDTSVDTGYALLTSHLKRHLGDPNG